MPEFTVIGPDGLSISPDTYPDEPTAALAIDEFVKRYEHQGYYSGVGFQLPIDRIKDFCTIEQI